MIYFIRNRTTMSNSKYENFNDSYIDSYYNRKRVNNHILNVSIKTR